MELVADAVDEVVGVLDLLAGGGGEQPVGDELLQVEGSALSKNTVPLPDASTRYTLPSLPVPTKNAPSLPGVMAHTNGAAAS